MSLQTNMKVIIVAHHIEVKALVYVQGMLDELQDKHHDHIIPFEFSLEIIIKYRVYEIQW